MILKALSFLFKFIEGRWILKQTKKMGLLFYLRFLTIARQSLLGFIFLIFAVQIFAFSLVGLVLIGVHLTPYDTETKVFIVLGLCAVTFLTTLIAMIYAFSQKTWLKHSGAQELISKLN